MMNYSKLSGNILPLASKGTEKLYATIHVALKCMSSGVFFTTKSIQRASIILYSNFEMYKEHREMSGLSIMVPISSSTNIVLGIEIYTKHQEIYLV